MNGQSAQCMFFTAKVIVFSAANVAGEATTPTAKAAQARSFVIGKSPFMSRGATAQRSQSQVRQQQGLLRQRAQPSQIGLVAGARKPRPQRKRAWRIGRPANNRSPGRLSSPR